MRTLIASDNFSYNLFGRSTTVSLKVKTVKQETILLEKIFSLPLVMISKLDYFYSTQFLAGYYQSTLKELTFNIVKKKNFFFTSFNVLRHRIKSKEILLLQKRFRVGFCFKKRLLETFSLKKKKKVSKRKSKHFPYFVLRFSFEFAFCRSLYDFLKFRRPFMNQHLQKRFSGLCILNLQNVGYFHSVYKALYNYTTHRFSRAHSLRKRVGIPYTRYRYKKLGTVKVPKYKNILYD